MCGIEGEKSWTIDYSSVLAFQRRMLCPAAPTSRARLACPCPRTLAKSRALPRPDWCRSDIDHIWWNADGALQ